jgi:hypothetical protein
MSTKKNCCCAMAAIMEHIRIVSYRPCHSYRRTIGKKKIHGQYAFASCRRFLLILGIATCALARPKVKIFVSFAAIKANKHWIVANIAISCFMMIVWKMLNNNEANGCVFYVHRTIVQRCWQVYLLALVMANGYDNSCRIVRYLNMYVSCLANRSTNISFNEHISQCNE